MDIWEDIGNNLTAKDKLEIAEIIFEKCKKTQHYKLRDYRVSYSLLHRDYKRIKIVYLDLHGERQEYTEEIPYDEDNEEIRSRVNRFILYYEVWGKSYNSCIPVDEMKAEFKKDCLETISIINSFTNKFVEKDKILKEQGNAFHEWYEEKYPIKKAKIKFKCMGLDNKYAEYVFEIEDGLPLKKLIDHISVFNNFLNTVGNLDKNAPIRLSV